MTFKLPAIKVVEKVEEIVKDEPIEAVVPVEVASNDIDSTDVTTANVI